MIELAWEIGWHIICNLQYNQCMFAEQQLSERLPVHGLGKPLFFYATIGSTNDRALEIAHGGAPHGALVVADEQTSGRGRAGRSWVTRPGAGLAFSLLLRPGDDGPDYQPLSLNVLGALAVAEQLKARGGEASIKWPNDVLLAGRKVAGILTEADWLGEHLEGVVVGIGVNVRPESVPRPQELEYPAISVNEVIETPVTRADLLCGVLDSIAGWLPRLGSPLFAQALQDSLAFLGEQVKVEWEGGALEGVMEGVNGQGAAQLRMPDGETRLVEGGGYSLRAAGVSDGPSSAPRPLW
jgi:BirA family biotin operon repressor/biotin-[acetyl-CoA-carboxylase] ligase